MSPAHVGGDVEGLFALVIAIAVYVLVAIVRKRLKLRASLHTILQILSLALFEKQPLDQLLAKTPDTTDSSNIINQLNLFPLISDTSAHEYQFNHDTDAGRLSLERMRYSSSEGELRLCSRSAALNER